MPNSADSAQVKFQTKIVNWSLDYSSNDSESKITTPILLQDVNGPCPLIAMVNSLLLNYEIQIRNLSLQGKSATGNAKLEGVADFKKVLNTCHKNFGSIELNKVLSQIGDLLLIYKEDKALNVEIDKLLNALPLLHTGLLVNPNLTNGDFAKEDLASVLFDVFELKFKHGWVINQIENENADLWGHDKPTDVVVDNDEYPKEDEYSQLVELVYKLQTFDQIQDFLLTEELAESGQNNLQLANNKALINKWIDLNRTQLTKIGLNRLNYELNEEEFIIFFRNNHFNTLFKKADLEFYLLITDSSFQDKSNLIIWQSFNSISGKDDLFFDGDFLPILDIDQDLPPGASGIDGSDYLLVKQLQEEEDAAMAKEMQQNYNRKAKAANAPPVKPESKSKLLQNPNEGSSSDKKEKKKKLNCVIA